MAATAASNGISVWQSGARAWRIRGAAWFFRKLTAVSIRQCLNCKLISRCPLRSKVSALCMVVASRKCSSLMLVDESCSASYDWSWLPAELQLWDGGQRLRRNTADAAKSDG
uniref:Uncharacterized protein n=1 Tax=Ditylenchus dipsaci TaxID=166011 RepID=A0A915CWM3_9BILA